MIKGRSCKHFDFLMICCWIIDGPLENQKFSKENVDSWFFQRFCRPVEFLMIIERMHQKITFFKKSASVKFQILWNYRVAILMVLNLVKLICYESSFFRKKTTFILKSPPCTSKFPNKKMFPDFFHVIHLQGPTNHQKQTINSTKQQLDDLSTRQKNEDDDGKVQQNTKGKQFEFNYLNYSAASSLFTKFPSFHV